ncbi:hypothetical protein CIHG_05702 [Coccidioides immitis H538.4]|uniref:Uncharacterized protein n=3 Tax=Coccidioides immitis TaxID=5501 RepID=A0A0J8R234_COCIT|nr:hypothetical protein CIRG_08484 [Coccidioides immitis RMSCC 2394]KMU78801.1 hypothetical protein CISG_01841 [Coccidioides immitis RMSCC 3703]KMU87935.1 hypothetical protein CIHG_05702 [Coccidioides immitis H538.4]
MVVSPLPKVVSIFGWARSARASGVHAQNVEKRAGDNWLDTEPLPVEYRKATSAVLLSTPLEKGGAESRFDTRISAKPWLTVRGICAFQPAPVTRTPATTRTSATPPAHTEEGASPRRGHMRTYAVQERERWPCMQQNLWLARMPRMLYTVLARWEVAKRLPHGPLLYLGIKPYGTTSVRPQLHSEDLPASCAPNLREFVIP